MAYKLQLKRGLLASLPNGSVGEPLFTTDTFDLYVGKGDGTNVKFQKFIASGSSSQFLKGDGSLDSTTYQGVLSGSGIVKSTGGTISYLTDNTANWDSAYNDKINSASVTGTTTKTLTLTQQDGGTITASWSDYDTAPVTSVFGRTGNVVATSGDYTTSLVTEGTNLYFTDARARAAITLTTTGSSGSATYIGGTLNIPTYTLAGLGGVPTSRSLTINGTSYDLSADRSWSVGTVTSIDMSVPTGFAITGNPITSSGTLALAFATGYSLPTNASQTNWDAAYNDKINSASVTGTTTKTLTLNQQDGGTITASWTDDNTDAVTSVFGRTGAVVAASGDYTTTQVTEGTNLYFTNARSIGSTLTGYISGAGTITSADSILSAIQKLNGNVAALVTGVSSVNGFTGAVTLSTTNIAEGTNLYFTQARVSANTDVAANTAARHNAVTLGTANGLSLLGQALSLGTSSSTTTGALSSTDWTTFNSKQAALNGTGFVKISGTTINYDNSTYYLASNPSNYITLTSLSGTSPISYNNTTGAFSISQASGTTNGFLSSTDWTTFNNKQSALTNPVTGTGTTNYLPKFTGTSAIGNSAITDDGTTITLISRALRTGVIYNDAAGSPSGQEAIRILNSNGYISFFNGGNSTRSAYIQGNTTDLTLSTSLANPILFYTSNTEKMRLDASGNLGLGVTPSAWSPKTLQIGSTSVFEYSINNSIIGSNFYYPGGATNLYMNNGYASFYQQYNGQHAWYNAPSGTAGNAITFTQAMTLDSAGRLLVGTALTPGSGEIKQILTRSGSTYLEFQNQTTNTGSTIGTSGENFIVYTNSGAIGSEVYTERIRITSGGNLLVGTTTDSGYKLDVNGSLRVLNNGQSVRLQSSDANGNYITFHNGIGAYSYIGSNYHLASGSATDLGIRSESNIVFSSGGSSERMRLNSSGNLGLGVTPSAWSTSFGIKVIDTGSKGTFYASDNDANVSFNQYFDGTNAIYKTTGTASRFALIGNEFQWRQAPSGTAGNAITFTQAMTLDASGRLGIGSTSPSSTLQVSKGGVTFQVTDTNKLTSNTFSVFGYSQTSWAIGTGSSGSFSGTEKIIITDSGNVGIGTSSPADKLHVVGTSQISSYTGIGVAPDSSTMVLVKGASTSSANFAAVFQNSAGTNLVRFFNNGKVNFGALPTSSAGLSSGDLWNDGGTLKIV